MHILNYLKSLRRVFHNCTFSVLLTHCARRGQILNCIMMMMVRVSSYFWHVLKSTKTCQRYFNVWPSDFLSLFKVRHAIGALIMTSIEHTEKGIDSLVYRTGAKLREVHARPKV